MKNIRLALRSLLHFRLYSAINVLGLALSLACMVVIVRYVYTETTVDHFNSRLDRMYVTFIERTNQTGGKSFSGLENHNRETTFVDLRLDPGVEKWSNFILLTDHVMRVGKDEYTVNSIAADTGFFQVFDYEVSAGSGDLSQPDNILITEALARKIFGLDDPLGKPITYVATGKTVTVTGLLAPTSTKSSMDFDVIVPHNHSRMWGRTNQTAVLLYPNQNHKAFNEKYSEYFDMRSWGYAIRYQLFPLKDVYMDTSMTYRSEYLQGKSSSVLILSVVGLMILLVGVFNFINIYTAVVLRRGRELGMKKVFGAPASRVFLQLLAENIMMIAFAIVIALALTEILNPVVRNLLGFDQMPFRRFDLFLTLGLLVILPLITTLFPFVHYNHSAPVKSLRSVGKTGGRGAGRQVFLVFQYVLTIGMVVISLFFLKQLRFMLNADIGFKTENIVKVPFIKNHFDYDGVGSRWNENQLKIKETQQRIDASPLFTAGSFGYSPIGMTGTFNFRLGDADNELKPVTLVGADHRWLKLFDIEIVEGRPFDPEIENFHTYNLIVTESALPYLGITDFRTQKIQPEDRLWWSSERPKEEMDTNVPYNIIGVASDFHPSHMGVKMPPVVLNFNDGFQDNPLLVGIVPGKKQEALEFMKELHAEMVGGEFTYSFLEDDLKALYQEDRKIATIYSIFTAIAILVSILGLFSLSLFDIQQRRREIAIRKVNGATTGDVLGLLLRRYLFLLGIAFLIAAPLAYFAIRKYLEGFAFKAPVSWWIFAVALTITAGVSLFTLIWQTRKAASANPADVIRSE